MNNKDPGIVFHLLRRKQVNAVALDMDKLGEFFDAVRECLCSADPSFWHQRLSAQPLDPASKDRRFVVGIDRNRLASTDVTRAEPEILAKYAAEMGVADEAILICDFADAAGLVRIV